MARRRVLLLLLAPGLLVLAGPARAQSLGLARASAVKAAFLYKFGSFVEWPLQAFAGPAAPLVIGVFGDDAVASELEQITQGRDIGGRLVGVRRVRGPDEVAGVHVLFAGGPRESRMREVLAAARGPVLTVADRPLGEAAAVLHFTEEEGRVRFVASMLAAHSRGLRLSAKLLAVAHHVEGPR